MVNCHSLQCQFSYDEFPSCLFVTFQLYLKRFPPPVVGQLLEDVKMFSKGLTSRDDVGITLDDLNRKVDRALSEIAEHFATTQKQKSSIEFQIKEIRARLNKHLDDTLYPHHHVTSGLSKTS
jgi:hypothetical protein